jgi:RHS repeat-associated protein
LHAGSPTTNTARTKVWTANTLPFGGVRTTTGMPMTGRFPGQWFQSESGLHQNWMRDYDPTTGRYLQADPLGLVDGASVYGYAGQNPLRWVDPRGEYLGPHPLVEVPTRPIIDTSSGGGAWVPSLSGLGALLGLGTIIATDDSVDCCAAEREILRIAKENNPGQCKPSNSKATLTYKLMRLKELLDARKAAFECINDGDPEHARQINDVQKLVMECSRRLGL